MSRFRKPLTRMPVRRTVAVAATLVALTGFGSAASAATVARTTAVPHRTASAAIKAPFDEGEAGVCANCKPPLVYRNGLVMGTGTPAGTITITPIYWAPAGYNFDTFDPTYRSLVNQYITDIAAASGTTSNVYSILPEYYQTANAPTRPPASAPRSRRLPEGRSPPTTRPASPTPSCKPS
jgi:hypothetical protein